MDGSHETRQEEMEDDDDARSRTTQVREGMGSKITFLRRPSSSLEGPPICTLPATRKPQHSAPGRAAAGWAGGHRLSVSLPAAVAHRDLDRGKLLNPAVPPFRLGSHAASEQLARLAG